MGTRIIRHLPAASPRHRVGLLGGSFDPPHLGHKHISDWALKQFNLDQVWWLVSPGNPLKRNVPASVDIRISLAADIVINPKTVISNVESEYGLRFSADTITSLKVSCPSTKFVWIMGADNLVGIHRWQRWWRIFEAVPVGVLARQGHNLAACNSVAARRYSRFRCRPEFSHNLALLEPPAWCFVNSPLYAISSTSIRERGAWSAPRIGECGIE